MEKSFIKYIGFTVFITLASCSATVSERANIIKSESDGVMTKNQLSDSIAVDSNEVNKSILTSVYLKAIEDYIDAVHQKDKTLFDTLFFIKRKNRLPDDFPDIQLPQSVKRTKLLLFTQQQADNHKQLYRITSPCINLIGGVEKNNAEFIFVTFYPEYRHQYDCYINYKLNSANKNYELERLTIEVLSYDKNEKPDHFAIYQDGKHIGNKPIK